MTALPSPPLQASVGRKLLGVLGTTLVFVLLGPLIGGIVTIVGLVVFGMDLATPGDALMVILAMLIYGLFMAYLIGVIPAAIVGAVIGFMDAFRGGARLMFAAGLGLASGVGWSMMLGNGDEQNGLFRALVVVSCLIATVICWKATRRRAGD